MGTYVEKNPKFISDWLPTTEENIEEIFDYLRTKANSAEDTLANALTALTDLYPGFHFSGPLPSPPMIPNLNAFDWTAGTLTQEMYLALFNQITTDINNNGVGFSTAVHDAIVARELAARRLSEQRTYQGALDNVGADGFNLPSGQVAYMEAEFARDIEAQNQAVINDLLAKDFELARKSKEFSITSGLQLEGMIRNTFAQLEGYSLEAAKAGRLYITQVFDSAVRLFDAEWKKFEMELQAYEIDTTLAEKIADARASVAVQALASALGGIHASMSLGASTARSSSRNRQWSISNSLSEQHPFVEQEI